MMHWAGAILSLGFTLTDGSPTPPIPNQGAAHDQQPATSNRSRSSWSRQDVFTLISVFVAVAAILTTVLVAVPKLRHWLCKPLECKRNLYSIKWDGGTYEATKPPPPPPLSFSHKRFDLS